MKPAPIAQVPEVKDVFALIDFVRDVDAVEKRLKLLEQYREEINAKIELIGKAEEIEALRSAASESSSKASKALDDTYAKVARLLDDAEDEAKRIVEGTREGVRSREVSLDARAAELRELGAQLASQDANLKSREGEADRKEQAARKALAEAAAIRSEYEAKLAKLRAAGVT